MKRFDSLSLLLIFVCLILITPDALSQNVCPHIPHIKINDKEIDVPQKDILNWREKLSPKGRKADASTELSKDKIKQIAKDFGLMEKTKTNPHLVFLDSDITYWHTQKLDESHLKLEFAARKILLEESERQNISIPDKKIFAEAAQKLVPFLQKEIEHDVKETGDKIVCEGDTSEKLTQQAWAALGNNDNAKALACANNNIRKWSRQADEQQTKAAKQGCEDTPNPEDLKSYFSSYWALSDIATSWFIKGQAFQKQSQWEDARDAYKVVIDKYPCSFTWDNRGWFWRTADTAREKYDEIRFK